MVQSALSESGIFRPLRDPAGGHRQFRATNHLQFGQRPAGARSAGVILAVVYSSLGLPGPPAHKGPVCIVGSSGSAGQPRDAFSIFGRWVSAFSWRGVI